jgi:hypothetical protein
MRLEKFTSFVSLVSAFVPALACGQTPTPTARDVISEVIEQAAKESSKNKKTTGDTTKLELWQTSPDEFAKELQRLFSKGAGESELTSRFCGKQIDWPGILDTARTERSKTDPNVTLVAVWITEVPLVARDGSPAYIGELALNIPKFVMPADKHVRVRATLSNISTMPVIDEKDHSKKTVVMIETEGETGAIASARSLPSPAAAAAGDENDWCRKLLKAPIQKYLPKGYSNPQVSLIDMTPAEHAAGMRYKISVLLQGRDSFNAIRYRIYDNDASAERAFKSLSKGLPADIAVIDDKMWYAKHIGDPEVPCMAFTAGKRTLTFVTCADQFGNTIVSGVSSQPYAGNSYQQDTTIKAGQLLAAGAASLEAQADVDFDEAWKKIFRDDQKK